MTSCVQSGVAAIRNHVTVTALPSACQGLTPTQIDSATGAALRSAAAGAQTKALRRARIAAASHFLEHMFVTVPAQRSEPQVSAPAAGWISGTAWGVAALCAWLVTVALGLGMMLRWVLRSRAVRGLAWTATALLTLVIGLGMTLVFFLPSQSRHPSAVVTGAHIIVATATFLFVFLAAIGAG